MKLLKPLLIILSCAVLLLAGCAEPPRKARILWPPPPDEPRLEFIGVYSSEDNFEKTAAEKAAEDLLGAEAIYNFKGPAGIAADGEGLVYISDPFDKNISVYDFNAREVRLLLKESGLLAPFGLTVDSSRDIYVADGALHKVIVFSPDGRMLRTYGGADVLEKPVYLALNERLRRLYVTDVKKNKIVVFDIDSRERLFEFGGLGDADGKFFTPQGLAIDKEDHLYVADMNNARIQVFDQDGGFKRKFGERGDTAITFEYPKDLAFDSDGNLWLIDSQRSYFRAYTKDGVLLLIAGMPQRSHHELSLGFPASIFMTQKGEIYITDFLHRRFARWQYLTPEYLQANPVTAEEMTGIKKP